MVSQQGGAAGHEDRASGALGPSEACGPVTVVRRLLPDRVEDRQSPAQSLAHSWCLGKELAWFSQLRTKAGGREGSGVPGPPCPGPPAALWLRPPALPASASSITRAPFPEGDQVIKQKRDV